MRPAESSTAGHRIEARGMQELQSAFGMIALLAIKQDHAV
jgi:hypothetical protein